MYGYKSQILIITGYIVELSILDIGKNLSRLLFPDKLFYLPRWHLG